jgi:3-oxoacyl-[acyl-carrier protein] reductase
MDLAIANKVALVAASSRGLGLAVATELGREGARLILCARGEAALKDAQQSIERETGAAVVAVPVDLSEDDAAATVVRAGIKTFGQIDILVTNAGGPPAGPFEQHDLDVWDAAIRLNLRSAIALTQGVLPGMKERRWGRILNITSIAVKQPVDNLILSNSVRAAVTGFARTLANEVAPFGVTVNNLLPGYTRTQRVEELAESMAQQHGKTPAEIIGGWEAQIPMGRLGTPEEFAALAAFLVSERASYITGTSIQVDGGWIRSLL